MGIKAIIALLCPVCGFDLDGLPTDAVFGCSNCHRAWEPDAERLVEVASIVQSEHRPLAPSVPLPFWSFALGPVLLPEEVTAPPRIYVSAFDLRRRRYFGDPGQRWTDDGIEIPASAPRRPLAGVTLHRAEAEKLAYYVFMNAIDTQWDVTGFDPDLTLVEPQLLLVEFTDQGEALVDPVSGQTYGTAAFCDLPGLRELADRTATPGRG